MAKAKSKSLSYDDSEYSEKEVSKNIFSNAYSFLEKKYFSFSEWLSKKGIPLNKLNDFLDEKGLPAFAFVSCFFILLIALIILLIVNLFSYTSVELNITDYSNNPLSNVSLSISDLLEKTKFSGTVNDGDAIRVKLKSGNDYLIEAIATDFETYQNQILFERGQNLKIKFNEKIVTGDLDLIIVDSETQKSIPLSNVVITYRQNGDLKEKKAITDEKGIASFNLLPINKKLTITINADSYQTLTQEFQLNESYESKTIKLSFNENDLFLLGKEANLTIAVVKENGDLLDDATVTLYNQDGEIIGTDITKLGKVLFPVTLGQVIRFVITKEDYKTYDSDKDTRSYRIQTVDETYTAKLLVGSSSLVINVYEKNSGPVSDVDVSLYNENNNLIEKTITQLDGVVTFTGLEKETNYIVTACKAGYYCLQAIANIEETNKLEFYLEKTNLDSSVLLSIYVYDKFNNPITSAKVNILKELLGKYISSGYGVLNVDLLGKTTIVGKHGDKLKVIASVGDTKKEEEITLDISKDNKLIFILDNTSKFYTINLFDSENNPIVEGSVLITSKTGEILFEDDLFGYNDVLFDNEGYNDIVIKYKDLEGNITTVSTRLGEDEEIDIKVNLNYGENIPIISFLELRDAYNSQSKLLSINKDYYAVFDVVIPEGFTNCGVHFRAGDDSVNDSENMTYGITGYKADSTSYRYSTTYTPGQQSIDYDNTGYPNELNKWLELNWNVSPLFNKQIMVKLKATSIDEKFILKYRVWCEAEGKVYRDPNDSVLQTQRSNTQKQFLYADTKEKSFDILEKPADCLDDLCVDYKFYDNFLFEYNENDFFAVKDEVYALEFSIFSTKNTQLTIDSQTDKANPILGLINYQEELFFLNNVTESEDVELSSSYFDIKANEVKKIYLFFSSKNTGPTHLSFKITDETTTINKKINFNVVSKKQLDVSVPGIISYNSPIVVDVKDKDSKEPIKNAFVKITSSYNELLGSVKSSNSGRYVINQNFSDSKILLMVTAPGYATFVKEIEIADSAFILGPDKLEINFGENISQEVEIFSLTNKSNLEISDLRYEVNYLEYSASLQVALDLPYNIRSNSSEKIDLYATIDPKANFRSTKAMLYIYGFIGNKQVVKEIEIYFYKGLLKNECLEIKPNQLYSYVGISEASTHDLEITIKNNCDKPLSITPQLLNASGKVLKKDEGIEIILPTIDLEAKEEVDDFVISVKNNKERKQTKVYDFEIAWQNPYYILENTKLKIELIDLSKSLTITPALSVISLIQSHDEQAAQSQATFYVKNVGKHIVTDVQISRFEPKMIANIEDKIEPMSFESIKPGETKPIVIRYSGKIDKATFADLQYQVTANAVGVSQPITTNFVVSFNFSSAGCLKIDQTRLNFYTKINEEKTKLINVTNQCAEPIGLLTHDQGVSSYFKDTFGDGTAVSIFPAIPTTFIPMGATVGFYIKIKPTQYFSPKIDKVLRFVGLPINQVQGGALSSDPVLFSLEVEAESLEQKEDYKKVSDVTTVPVCDTQETVDFTFPTIVKDCKQDGYCDSEAAAKFILDTISSLHKDIISISNQVENKVIKTSCSQSAANNGYCPIEDILSPQKMKEYKEILLYLQNDSVTEKTINSILKENAKDYSTLKNYTTKANVGMSTGGLQMIGNVIHVPVIKGCGRYKLELTGYVSTKNITEIEPEKAYFFLNILDSNTTEQCNKSIENVMIFLPKDLKFIRTNTGDTWLTIVSGNKDFAEPIAKDIFGSENRFVPTSLEQKKYNILNVSVGSIAHDKDPIAKIFFNNINKEKLSTPEEMSIVINESFGVKEEGYNTPTFSEEFKKETARNIKAILEGKPANVCISKDKSYMLILSLEKDFGSLYLKSKTQGNLQLKPTKTCAEFSVKSAINEQIRITHEPLSGIKINFNVDDKDYDNSISLLLEKDKDKDFNVCITSDLSLISSWHNQEIKIIAESMFSDVGKINSKRKSEALLKVTNYGITPVDFLTIIQKEAEILNTEENTKVFYAYVDWDKTYSSEDMQTYCDSLKKYNEKIGDNKSIFITPKDCKISETKSEKSAKNTRALNKSGIYLGTCIASCAAYQGAADFLWHFVPAFGQVKYGKDLLWNCVPGCAIPSASVYLNESGSKVVDNILDFVTDVVPGVKQLKEKFGFSFSKEEISAADYLVPATTVAAIRNLKLDPVVYSKVTEHIDPEILSSIIDDGVIPLTGEELTNFNKLLSSQLELLNTPVSGVASTSEIPSTIPSSPVTSSTPSSSPVTSSTPIAPTTALSSADDIFIKNLQPKILNNKGVIDFSKISALSNDDLSKLRNILEKSGSDGLAAGLSGADKVKLIENFDKLIVSKSSVLTGNELANFKSQLSNQFNYLTRQTHGVANKPVFNPLNSADDAFIKNIIPKISDKAGGFDYSKFKTLSVDELVELRNVIERGKIEGFASNMFSPDTPKFLNRFDTYISSKTPTTKNILTGSELTNFKSQLSNQLSNHFELLNNSKVSTPNVTSSNAVITPNATTPGAATPNATTPGAATPNVTTPGAATPNATTPGAATSNVTTPGAATPNATTPGAATPNVTTPGAATTGTTASPSVASVIDKPYFKPLNAADEVFVNNLLPKITDGKGGIDFAKFNDLGVDDLTELRKVIERGNYEGFTANMSVPDKSKFLENFDDLISSKTKISTTTVNEITQKEFTKSVSSINKSIKEIGVREGKVKSELARLKEIKKPSSKNLDEIAALEDDLLKMQLDKDIYNHKLQIYDEVSSTGAKNGKFQFDDTVKEALNEADDQLELLKTPSKWKNIGIKAGKMATDIAVVWLSNITAQNALKRFKEKGKLNDLMYLQGEIDFKKQTWYRVQVFVSDNGSYTQEYVVEEPNITSENVIYYKSNKEVLHLNTDEQRDGLFQTNNPQVSEHYVPKEDNDEEDFSDISNVILLQTAMYTEYESKLNNYNQCTFVKNKLGTGCTDLNQLDPDHCAAFAIRVARVIYNLNYIAGNACDVSGNNFGTRHKIIWENKDGVKEFDKRLIPGSVITIGNTGGTTLDCDPSHVALYVGRNGFSHYILHQYGDKSYLEPIFKNEGGRFTIEQIHHIVIPTSGYALYDQIISNTT